MAASFYLRVKRWVVLALVLQVACAFSKVLERIGA